MKTTKQFMPVNAIIDSDAKESSIMELLDSKIRSAQEKHFHAFFHSGSDSYTELGHNLVALARVRNRVINALDLLNEDPNFV